MFNIGILGIVKLDTSVTSSILTGIMKNKVKYNWKLYSLDNIDRYFFNTWDINNQQIDGIIQFYNHQSIESYENNETLQKIPRIDICPVSFNENKNVITVNDITVGKLAAEHLVISGYTNFAFVGSRDVIWSNERKKGFIDHLKKNNFHNIQAFENYSHEWHLSGYYDKLIEWIKGLEYNTGVLIIYDYFARLFLQYCANLNIGIPTQIGVIGVNNDIITCESCVPMLTAVKINFEDIGLQASKILNEIISGIYHGDRISRIEPHQIIYRESTRVHQDPHIAKALRYIHNYACTGITVKEICYEIPISRSVLFNKFKKITGETIYNKILTVKLNKAIYLLKNTDLYITEISAKCGFKNPSRLIEIFKSKYKVTPKQFRLSK